MKKIFGYVLILSTFLINILPLHAAKNAIEIVDLNNSAKQLSDDGMTILNTINTETSDLANGKVDIEITLDNSKKTEIFYVIDYSSRLGTSTDNQMRLGITTNTVDDANKLELKNNIYQGIITRTTEQEINIPLDNKNIENNFNVINNLSDEGTSQDVSYIKENIDKAISLYSTDATNKFMIVYLTNFNENNSDYNDSLKTSIQNAINSKINVILYGIELQDANYTKIEEIFKGATIHKIPTQSVPSQEAYKYDISFEADVTKQLPITKNGIATRISFDEYILNNFTIENITAEQGNAKFDETNKEVVWEVGNVDPNQVIKLKYTITVNDNPEESLITGNIPLRTNKQVIVTEMGRTIGTFPALDRPNEICSPAIKITDTVTPPGNPGNPDTGIANYVIFGCCLLAVGAITLVILNSKSKFERI